MSSTKYDMKMTKMEWNYLTNLNRNVSEIACQLIHYFLSNQKLSLTGIGGGVIIKVHNKYNTKFVGYLSDRMPFIDLTDCFHSHCGLMKTVTHINSGYMVGQISNSCSIIYLFIKK